MLRGVLLLAFGAAEFAPAAAQPTDGRIEVVGAPEVVFDWARDHCAAHSSDPEGWDIPDSPPRAIRQVDGSIRIFALHFTNLALVGGRNMARFRHADCRSMLPSAKDPDPEDFAEYEWVVSPYTLDGRRVFALVHQEYHGWLHDSRCGTGHRTGWRDCSYFSTTSAVSDDGGANFRRAPPRSRLIAAPTERFSPEMTSAGVGDPTNIVRHPRNGRFYFLARAMAFGNQPVGICLFRAETLDSDAWHGWDGTGFGTRSTSPYGQTPPAPCTPVLKTSDAQYSVTWNTVLERFVLLGRNNKEVFYRLSDDLVRWSPPRRLLDVAMLKGASKPVPLESYHSILDPASPSRSFDVSGARPYLYFVHWRVRDGRVVNSERDILRVQLEVLREDHAN